MSQKITFVPLREKCFHCNIELSEMETKDFQKNQQIAYCADHKEMFEKLQAEYAVLWASFAF